MRRASATRWRGASRVALRRGWEKAGFCDPGPSPQAGRLSYPIAEKTSVRPVAQPSVRSAEDRKVERRVGQRPRGVEAKHEHAVDVAVARGRYLPVGELSRGSPHTGEERAIGNITIEDDLCPLAPYDLLIPA